MLDVGCGTGSFALMLAERGVEIVGVDPAGASLVVARGTPGAGSVRWVHGDATAVPDDPAGRVDLGAHSRFIPATSISTGHTHELLLGMWELLQQLGRVPRLLIWDNESGIGRGKRHAEEVGLSRRPSERLVRRLTGGVSGGRRRDTSSPRTVPTSPPEGTKVPGPPRGRPGNVAYRAALVATVRRPDTDRVIDLAPHT